jgi:hypothetical protein
MGYCSFAVGMVKTPVVPEANIPSVAKFWLPITTGLNTAALADRSDMSDRVAHGTRLDPCYEMRMWRRPPKAFRLRQATV